MNNGFEGTNALITGASRGLGRAISAALVERGAQVVMVARDQSRLEEAVRDLGPRAHTLPADIGDPEAPHRIAMEAAARVGPIDLLVNNASTLGPTPLRLLIDTERRDLERVLAVNLLGPFELARVIGGAMALRGRGTILNISSDAAVEAYPRWGAYGTSKAGLDHLSAILAAELEETGVRVLAVDPGEMDTEMHRAAIPNADPASLARPEIVAGRILRVLADGRAAGRLLAMEGSAA